jgi:hypothetical protein
MNAEKKGKALKSLPLDIVDMVIVCTMILIETSIVMNVNLEKKDDARRFKSKKK